ncbi:DNA polymerase III subunit beta [Mesorhizobium sp. M00.F.Ca.ET.217.01.1.1]|uniref:DNA polymerase III subunit beta n=1 Tax=Mesorhizobium sp. M00.F.Ca.ET.217.01.1.1 TaxID=2500529 RepID=UPI000FDC0F96|nr:DNA polymerase III subunit beta [Mesorhizobium sp. M00.F.Ca.ET.217.01.1.1]TGQ19283.1 DNA polymerase III subunit beta [Mesorhizobium sp. M00.F.Ca.ET.217.01.1.1]
MRIPRSDLARLLASTTKVVEARNTIPILSTVRLVADGDVLTVTATDLDIEVQASAPCEGDLAVCVDAKLLAGIVGKLPTSAVVEFDLKADNLTVKSGRSTFKLQTLPVDDFPSFSADGFAAEFTADLAALFAPVAFAISTEETRYYLNGIYLHAIEDGDYYLRAVATDGHRLSSHSTLLPEGVDTADIFKGVIVPRKLVGLVPKGAVNVSLSDTKIRITAPDVEFTSKLIDGTFPDYQRVIPKANDKIITFDSPAMRQAAERVSVVSSERGRAIRLSFAGNQAVLAVSNPDQGSANEEIEVSYDGDKIDIGFNSAYVAELIGIFPPGEIKLALSDGGSPAVFTSPAAPNLLAVLMPMRV